MMIRPFKSSDAEAVRLICRENSKSFANGRHDILLNLYCNYYIEQEPKNCLVAVDDKDIPIGYVICSGDWNRYCRAFRDRYLPELDRLSRVYGLKKRLEMLQLKPLAKDYPAHLHIDVLPAYQGKKAGKRLLSALFAKLQEDGVTGIMLCVGKDNHAAHRFYEREGMIRITTVAGSVVYVKKL